MSNLKAIVKRPDGHYGSEKDVQFSFEHNNQKGELELKLSIKNMNPFWYRDIEKIEIISNDMVIAEISF